MFLGFKFLLFLIIATAQAGQIIAGIYLELSFNPEIRATLASDSTSGTLTLTIYTCYFYKQLIYQQHQANLQKNLSNFSSPKVLDKPHFFSLSFCECEDILNVLFLLFIQPLLSFIYANHVTMKRNDQDFRLWNCWRQKIQTLSSPG